MQQQQNQNLNFSRTIRFERMCVWMCIKVEWWMAAWCTKKVIFHSSLFGKKFSCRAIAYLDYFIAFECGIGRTPIFNFNRSQLSKWRIPQRKQEQTSELNNIYVYAQRITIIINERAFDNTFFIRRTDRNPWQPKNNHQILIYWIA